MNIIKMISKYNFNEDKIDRLNNGYIVVHYVGATGGAKSNCEYYAARDRGASSHYFVDHNGDVYQSVEDKNVAWHCGASSYKHPTCRNKNSIGIELCCRTTGDVGKADKNWYFEDPTVTSAVELTRELMKKYNIPEDHVIRHYDVTGKTCPAPYVFNSGKHTWEEFQNLIKNDSAPIPNPASKTETTPKEAFLVKVSIKDLNIRKGPGTDYPKTGKYTGIGVFTIIETRPGKGSDAGWGLLKSYPQENGWISLDFAKRI